jgi:hypothetical protein
VIFRLVASTPQSQTAVVLPLDQLGLAPVPGYIGEAGQRLKDGLDRGVGHLVAIQGALGRKAHRKLAISPDVASVELGSGLEHRNAQRRSPRRMAQSSDEDPLSPLIPGCTIRQV